MGDREGTLRLALLLLCAVPRTYAQSSCPAGTADLDGDGVCHQCWSYVPHFRSGHGQRDVSNTLANNAAGCVRTICFIGPKVDVIVVTMETSTTTNLPASCSSEYGCYASCPGIEMPRPAYTQSRTQCPLPPAVSSMAITLNGGLEQGQQAVYTCEPGGAAPTDGDATRTCQAAVAPAVGYSWSGIAPTQCGACYRAEDRNDRSRTLAICRVGDQTAQLSNMEAYHGVCQRYGMTAYTTTASNGCYRDNLPYPVRVNACNMFTFSFAGFDYEFVESVPVIAEVYAIAYTENPSGSGSLGLEWNAVGPCDSGTTMQDCGSATNSNRGMAHARNPIYGANHDVKNAVLSGDQYIACAP
eukprot:COSAG02_NODE_743_length_17764_cov_9.908916_6_plen_356_part_00